MRLLVFTLFVSFVFASTHIGSGLFGALSEKAFLAAAFLNDSVIVDLIEEEGESPDVVPEADSTTPPPPETGGSVFDLGGDDENGDSGLIDEVVVVLSGESGSENDPSLSGGTDTGVSEEQVTVSAESILNTLMGNQAITSGGTSGNTQNPSGGGGTSISGSKTREALLSRGIKALTIPPRPESSHTSQSKARYHSRADLALIVSSEMVKNPDISDVFYTTSAITITYQARGRLLFALPIPYVTTLALDFNAPTPKSRVRVTFPWYKFFMWTGISKKELRNHIDAIIVASPEGDEYDRAATIFEKVSELIADQGSVRAGSVRRVQ